MGLDGSVSQIELKDREFEQISRLVYDRCGIRLSEGKRELVKARLGKRIRNGAFGSFQEYYHYVVQDRSREELIHLLDSISTNYTFFFREEKHFDYLRSQVLPELIDRSRHRGKKLRFWSAGCSSGEEAYSLGITIFESIDSPGTWSVKILATDLSTKVLNIAARGIYSRERTNSIPSEMKKKYFLKGVPPWEGHVKVKDSLRQSFQFQRLNLMEPFCFPEPFNCIFCRNVMIYFDRKTQADLVNRFYGSLEEGGYLFIGHSESLTGIPHPYRYIRPAVYRK